MNKCLFVLISVIFIPTYLTAQSVTESYSTDTGSLFEFSETITQDLLRKHLTVLASDSMLGRDTGTPGLEKAANYLAGYYRSLDIKPSGVDGTYFQPFDLNATVTDSIVHQTYKVEEVDTVKINHSVEAENSGSDYISSIHNTVPIEGKVVFAGFGVNDSLRNVHNLEEDSLNGKWVLVFENIPHVVDGDTLIHPGIDARERLVSLIRDHDANGILLIPDHSQAEFQELAEINSQTVSIPTDLKLAYRDNARRILRYSYAYNQISPGLATELLGLSDPDEIRNLKDSLIKNIQEFRAVETSYYLRSRSFIGQKTIESKNVVAYFEGADPLLRDEFLVLTGHYDHVGIGTPDKSGDFIYNGADDNGSGTAGLMAVAYALNEAKKSGFKPRRSILFLHVSAEESGLLGSRYYSDHPIIPIENTVATFNTDMIGRSDPEHIRTGNTDYVYLIGGEIISSDLDSLVTSANEMTVKMHLDRKYNDLNDPNQFYRRSDHWNFGRLSVPFVFFFTGVHEDYHQPSDHVDKIEFDKYTRLVRLIYTSTINVANFDQRPSVDNQQFIEITN